MRRLKRTSIPAMVNGLLERLQQIGTEPAIDLGASGTRKEERLLPVEMLEQITLVRRSLMQLKPVDVTGHQIAASGSRRGVTAEELHNPCPDIFVSVVADNFLGRRGHSVVVWRCHKTIKANVTGHAAPCLSFPLQFLRAGRKAGPLIVGTLALFEIYRLTP